MLADLVNPGIGTGMRTTVVGEVLIPVNGESFTVPPLWTGVSGTPILAVPTRPISNGARYCSIAATNSWLTATPP
jgi:hypothetical protein